MAVLSPSAQKCPEAHRFSPLEWLGSATLLETSRDYNLLRVSESNPQQSCSMLQIALAIWALGSTMPLTGRVLTFDLLSGYPQFFLGVYDSPTGMLGSKYPSIESLQNWELWLMKPDDFTVNRLTQCRKVSETIPQFKMAPKNIHQAICCFC